MDSRVVLIGLISVCLVHALPTVYKYNENKMLEADLIPVSSTVIPLPVYQVSYGLHVRPSLKDEKVEKPAGPITLITVHSKNKKPTEQLKPKPSDVSTVKEIKKNVAN